MNNGLSDRERDFFVTGAKTYVDVDDAMAEFRRLVQQQCRTIVRARLGEVNQACGMHWMANDLNDYSQKTSDDLYVGNQVEVEGLGGLYFCLRLSRKDDGKLFASVFLYRLRASLAVGLWDRSTTAPSDMSYVRTKNNLILERPLPGDKVRDFADYLDQAITAFIAFMSDSGGLRKYLALGSEQD
jgi:hypothetical protein